ncbi:MAG: DUF2141 domain-containing protein [Opitutales bacterium]|nr:DUF2141 domain-containing protein [Opitutales bacterium]
MNSRILAWLLFTVVSPLPVVFAAPALELVVTVSGIEQSKGEIGIALFSSENGFPMGPGGLAQVWLPASSAADGSVSYTFADLAPGRYAVSASHDLNGNRKIDTNWVGIPREPWGVSNGVRPRLRAPTFAEASFELHESPESRSTHITVSLKD